MTSARDPVGEWYRRQAMEADRLAARLKELEERRAPVEEIDRVRRALERARYVGD